MKPFLKNTLSVMLGIFLMHVIGCLFFLTSIIGSIGAGSGVVLPTSNAGLKIDMSKINLVEYNYVSNPLAGFNTSFQEVAQIQLLDAVRAINDAAADPAIKYIYLKPEAASGGLATLEEFRYAIEEFRKSGKPVIAYMDNATNGGYFLGSVADKLYISSAEGAGNQITGLSARLFFIKDLINFFGIKMQLIRHGEYKSAGEMFIKSNASKENIEQNQAYIDGIWNAWSKKIAASRGFSQAEFNAHINSLDIMDAHDMMKAHFVDGVFSLAKMKEKLLSFHEEGTKELCFVSLADYVTAHKETKWAVQRGADKVAVIYANGEIVESSNGRQAIVGNELARTIAAVRADSTIHNVVFRVNSPGGSVLASDKIRHEIDLLCKEKNVIASYGDYAASGGYWISSGCHTIFTDHSTLTGSIGVFSMIPDFSAAVNRIGIHHTTIKSNDHAGMLSGFDPLDKVELEYMQRSVDSIYERFTTVVANGRGKSKEYINSIARGRVWAGDDAKKIGLCDGIGDLKHAITVAAAKANPNVQFSDIVIEEYPKTIDGLQSLMMMLQPAKDNEVLVNAVKNTPLEPIAKCMNGVLRNSNTATYYARLPYYIDIQ